MSHTEKAKQYLSYADQKMERCTVRRAGLVEITMSVADEAYVTALASLATAHLLLGAQHGE